MVWNTFLLALIPRIVLNEFEARQDLQNMDVAPNQSKASRTPKRWKTVFTILVCLAGLYIAYRLALFYAVRVRIEAIRRAGLPVTCVELDKWYTHVPAGENAADLYVQASERYNMWTNRLPQAVIVTNVTATRTNIFSAYKRSELLPVVGFVYLPPRTEPLPAEMNQLIGEYLADNAEALRLLHQAASMKRCRFPVDWSKGLNAPMMHLASLKQGARLLQLEAVESAENHKPEEAAESVIASDGIAGALNQEPNLISHLVANACHAISIGSLQLALNRISLTDEQLARLAVTLAETENPQGLTQAFIGERCCGINGFDQIRSGKEAIKDMFWFQELPPWLVLALYKPMGLLELDELVYLSFAQDLVRTTRLPALQSIAAAQSLTDRAKGLPFYAVLSRGAFSVLGTGVSRDVAEVAHTRTAVTSLAIERYRLANGKLPEKLDELVPTYLSALPQDPFDGKPLRYKKLVKGYVVYSVGEDGEDNGGAEECHKDIAFIVER